LSPLKCPDGPLFQQKRSFLEKAAGQKKKKFCKIFKKQLKKIYQKKKKFSRIYSKVYEICILFEVSVMK